MTESPPPSLPHENLKGPQNTADTGLGQHLEQYKDQWGGKIETGEEMWWSGYWPEMDQNRRLGRMRFKLDPRHFMLLRLFQKALLTAPSRVPTVIDFGCGTGGGTINFSRYLDIPFKGFDIFPTQIRIARQQAYLAVNHSTFDLLASKGQIPLPDESVDILFSSDVLGHVPDIVSVLKDWHRVLKTNGSVVLFTEARCSAEDESIMGKLYQGGIDMIGSVPEHISLFPREMLEKFFAETSFVIENRYSANVCHFLFFPKDYVQALENQPRFRRLYRLARIWSFCSKLIPFYPKPLHLLKNILTLCFGQQAYGTGYFYLLKKFPSK